MTMNNQNQSVNHIPFLSEEIERTLRRLAWKDEIFREALIADPKGIIQYLFHQYLPNGKLPDDLTIKVIEEDPSTHHIVLPALPDQFLTFEIPEEEQLELIANMGRGFDRVRGHRRESGPSLDGPGCGPDTYRPQCRDGQPLEKQERSDSNLKKRSRDFTRPPYDSKTQEGSKPESEYSYGQDNKKRRTETKNQSS